MVEGPYQGDNWLWEVRVLKGKEKALLGEGGEGVGKVKEDGDLKFAVMKACRTLDQNAGLTKSMVFEQLRDDGQVIDEYRQVASLDWYDYLAREDRADFQAYVETNCNVDLTMEELELDSLDGQAVTNFIERMERCKDVIRKAVLANA